MATGVVYLQCGPNNNNSAYGWHHIEQNHQGQWQSRVEQIVAASGGQGIPWDDLMDGFTGMTLDTPGSWTVEYGGKRCYTVPITVADENNQDLFTINPTVVVSMTNNRLITSYPTTNQDCTRQAPWDQ